MNHDPAAVKRWLETELRGKRVTCANAKHECYVLQNFGVDPEALDIHWNDVFFQAALLDEKRYRINLDTLMREELGRGKLDLGDTEAWPIHERPAELIAPYAIADAVGAMELDMRYMPRIWAENLTQVLQLENDLVYSTVEMERNGALLDVELLDRWIAEVKAERDQRLWEIHRLTGLNVSPTKRTDMLKLFAHLGLENKFLTEKGQPSFDEEALLHFPQAPVKLALEVRQLESLLSKYLLVYREAVDSRGVLRYELHQLRAEAEGATKGTITGRYSSSNVNIQQVSEKEKQPLLLQRWPIRRLFIAPPGERWVSSDASQIELRIFAHYAAVTRDWRRPHGMPRLAEAYRQDPLVDFHDMVTAIIKVINRKYVKNVNFCKLYGGGVDKIMFTINRAIPNPADRLTRDQVAEFVDIYDREFPETRWLMGVMSQVAEERRFVRTFLGRRRRFEDDDRYYCAPNCVFQGTAADIMKKKILEIYRARKKIGLTMRFTVHDEKDSTSRNDNIKAEMDAVLNEQTTPLTVPIRWNTGVGANWQEAH